MNIPVLETERLRLRGYRQEDFAQCAAMWADPVVTRCLGIPPAATEDAWRRFLQYAGHWALFGFGYWLAEDRLSGDFVGEVGFANFKRDLGLPLIGKLPEIGWILAARFHGKGYATEAARAATSWGDQHFSTRATTCIIDPENAASIRVAIKSGYRQLQEVSYRGRATLAFIRDRADLIR